MAICVNNRQEYNIFCLNFERLHDNVFNQPDQPHHRKSPTEQGNGHMSMQGAQPPPQLTAPPPVSRQGPPMPSNGVVSTGTQGSYTTGKYYT